jgi:hypothetical protein
MFAGLFGSNTPQYKGLPRSGSSRAGGLFGFITGLFGGGESPAYAGSQGPPSASSGFSLFPSSPTYVRPTPVAVRCEAPAPAEEPAAGSGSSPEDVNGKPEEPQPKAVTIIVRPGPGTTVEEVVQFLQDRVLDD